MVRCDGYFNENDLLDLELRYKRDDDVLRLIALARVAAEHDGLKETIAAQFKYLEGLEERIQGLQEHNGELRDAINAARDALERGSK